MRGRRKVPRKFEDQPPNFKECPWWPEELEAWKPPEKLTVSECADKYRILSTKSARPGKWETNFVPFNRQVMDAFATDCIEEIWYVKPTQTGGTDGILNMILYAALQDPGPAMIVEPNEQLADEISQERLDDMIRTCDRLQEVKSFEREDTTKKKKTFSSMTLYLGYAGSPTSLASRPIRYVFFDEVNKYPAFSGQEASPIALGKERTNTFILTRKMVYVSTPTIEGAYISAGEAGCDARFRYFIVCPHCGAPQNLVFGQVKWPEGERDPLDLERHSWYECVGCKGRIQDSEKLELIRRGKWIDLKSNLDFTQCIEQIAPRRVGFQINRLYSPWHSFGMVAAEFIRSKDDVMNLMNWKNSWMAEEWIERIYHKTENEILAHKNDCGPLVVPKGTIALTAGIDPGQGGFWFVVLAWVRENDAYTVHVLHYGFLTSWDLVRQLMIEGAYQGEGKAYPVWRAAVDTGGSRYGEEEVTMTEDAYNFLRRFGGNRIFASKGVPTGQAQRMRPKPIDKMPKSNQLIPGGITLWLIDTDSFKDILHYRLQVNPGDPGGISFHAETQDDLAKHILAEEKRKNKQGQNEWIWLHRPNHLFDCLCLALAMGDTECWGGVRVLSREQAIKPQIPAPAVETKPDSPEKIMERTMGKPNPQVVGPWMGNRKGWMNK